MSMEASEEQHEVSHAVPVRSNAAAVISVLISPALRTLTLRARDTATVER